MKVVKLKDIAEILGVSVTTVSKALKDYPDISKETKQHVKILAEKLNYKPSALAVNFRNKESRIIGVIIPEIAHHFFSNVINGIIHEAEKKGYLVITLQSGDFYSMEEKNIELLIDQRVDGIIMSLSNETNSFEHIRKLKDKDIPFVLIDKVTDEIECSKVVIDDKHAAYTAVDYLIKTGCKKILHLNGPLSTKSCADRLEGYKKALKKHGIPYNAKLVYGCINHSHQKGINFTNDAFNKYPDIDGVFATTDLIASGALTALRKKKIKVPEEVSIMGFSNWELSSIVSPTLSTVEQPNFEMGKKAISILLDEIQKSKTEEHIEKQYIELPTEVIVRESTRKL
ncbi:LacI family DNA-binding transcriptional regulator [Ascidiimonas sp. W6]|uniref:LacI family DNA-binding transcriptional regulator n=1 Tax=Ascidiimonas meishanensis TaxID=3128903 RepID=UPI0030EED313